ncbi:VOC family protein [Tabrizicola flagellatus]|uniref:VOC family protein n=1 Tax=Tabrizicola flagellatus TaxID=2593021 RepID=UPI0011F184E6|nr:VOC family protein [Tabrizicola flagellatus]
MRRLSNWTEIPVRDMARARAFWGALLGADLPETGFGPETYAMFPAADPFNTGALVAGPGRVPTADGVRLYLDARGRIAAMHAAALAAGAQEVMPPTVLSDEAGEVSLFLDPEGNLVGLQSPLGAVGDDQVTDSVMRALLAGTQPGIGFLLHRGPGFDDPALAHLQWEHARNMFTLMKRGLLAHVTAFPAGTGVLGFGLLTLATTEAAEALLAEDPGVRSGRLRAEVLGAMTFTADRHAHLLR